MMYIKKRDSAPATDSFRSGTSRAATEATDGGCGYGIESARTAPGSRSITGLNESAYPSRGR